jgi:hypothetical protein
VTPFPSLALPARSYCAYVSARARGDARIAAFCDWLEEQGASAASGRSAAAPAEATASIQTEASAGVWKN